MDDRKMWDIGKWDVPKSYTACPSCGFQYGHHKTRVCINCQECSKCCQCDNPEMEDADIAVPKILEEI